MTKEKNLLDRYNINGDEKQRYDIELGSRVGFLEVRREKNEKKEIYCE